MRCRNDHANRRTTGTGGKSRLMDRVGIRFRAVGDAFTEPDPRGHKRRQPSLITGNGEVGEAVNTTMFFWSHPWRFYLEQHPKTKPDPDLFPVAARTVMSTAKMAAIFIIVEFFGNAPLHVRMNGIGCLSFL